MKTNKIFSLAVLALLTAACSSDIAPEQQGSRVIPFTATLSAGTATTRAIEEEDDRLVTYWEKKEKVALIHDGVMDVMEVTDVDDETGAATISGNLTGDPQDGDDVTVIYPASAVDGETLDVKDDLLKEQDGDKGTISQQFDLRKSTGAKLQVVGEAASLKGIVSLKNQLAIVQLSFRNDGGDLYYFLTQLTIKDGNSKVLTTVNETVENTYWIAMAPAKDATFSFEFIKDGETYTCTKTGVTLEAGKYYQSTMMVNAPEPEQLTVSATGYKGTYDGQAHGITVTVTEPATGATIKYRTTADGEYNLTSNPTYTDAGKHTVYYQVTKDKYETVTGSADVEITQAAATISFKEATITKTYGDAAFTNTLTNTGDGAVKYSTTATNVTVNESTGEVTITGAGEATIKATVTDGTNYTYATKEISYTLTVNKKAGSISFATAAPSQALSATTADNTYTQTVTNIGDGMVTYSISDNTCGATINASTGKVTFTQVGSVKVTATVAVAEDGIYSYATTTATYTLTVAKAAGSISYTTQTVEKLTTDAAFTNTLTKVGDGKMTYSSSDTDGKVVTVNSSTGELTIKGAGEATITATVADSDTYTYATTTATYKVIVKVPVISPHDSFGDGGDPLK